MNLSSAQSLVAWLWAQHPAIVYALAAKVPRPLGQCFSCDLDLFAGSCEIASSGTCFGISDPGVSLDPVSLDPASLDLGCESLGLEGGATCGIPTLSESDLTPVGTCAVTGGGCGLTCVSGTSVTATDAATSNALSGVAGFLTSSAGLTALANATAAYFKAQAASSQASAAAAAMQAAVVNAQTARAINGQTALPVQYVANGATGTTTPMISTTGGLLPLTSSILSSFTPSSIETFFAQYGTWLLIGGAAAFLAYAATRRKRT
jgi:hypothetical protein